MAAPLCRDWSQPRLLLQLLKRAQSSRSVAGPGLSRRRYHATPQAASPAVGDGRGRFLFLGAPGVGKGTFASIIAPQMGLRVISAGDLIRNALKAPVGSGSGEGGGVVLTEGHHEVLRQGGLLPDCVVEALVKHALLLTHGHEQTQGFILDGYPRTVHQAGVLESWLCEVGLKGLHGAVSVELEEWVAVAKVMARHNCGLCGRSFNSAHIVLDGYDMPAMLPPAPGLCGGLHDRPCPVHDRDGGYHIREDDRDEAVVRRRYDVYRQQTKPLLGFYEERGLLHRFTVKKGIKDAPKLMQAMLRKQTGKKTHR